jgi:GAF domain-containing protein
MLEQMTQRLQAQRSFEAAIETLLTDVVALHGAEYGDLQLLVGDELVLIAHRGLSAPFLRAFRRVDKADGCACGRALREGRTIVVADVMQDPDYAEFRSEAEAAGYRAVQSTPLTTSRGRVLGMVSTLFANVHEPTPIELDTLARYSRIAADYLETLIGADALAAEAQRMNAALYADAVA